MTRRGAKGRRAALATAACAACALLALAGTTARGAFTHGRGVLELGPHPWVEGALPLSKARILLRGEFGDYESGLVQLQADGSLDQSFGQNGVLTIGYDDVVVDQRGRILLASSRRATDSSFDATVTRLLPNGTPDPSFGEGGTATLDFGRRLDFGTAVGVQPDGRILVGGFTANGGSRGRTDGFPVVARLLADGIRDSSFAKGGQKAMTPYGPPLVEESTVFDFAMGPHGTVLVGLGEEGQIGIARLRSHGAIDSSFGDHGAIAVGGFDQIPGWEYFDPIAKLAVQADGSIVSAGTVSDHVGRPLPYSLMVLRFRPNGRPDRSFGRAGHTIMRFRGDTFAGDFAVQRSGRIVVAANTHPKAKRSYLALASFRPDGAYDRRFGNRGRLKIRFGGWTFAQALVLQPPERAVVVGLAEDRKPPIGPSHTVLARVSLSRHRGG